MTLIMNRLKIMKLFIRESFYLFPDKNRFKEYIRFEGWVLTHPKVFWTLKSNTNNEYYQKHLNMLNGMLTNDIYYEYIISKYKGGKINKKNIGMDTEVLYYKYNDILKENNLKIEGYLFGAVLFQYYANIYKYESRKTIDIDFYIEDPKQREIAKKLNIDTGITGILTYPDKKNIKVNEEKKLSNFTIKIPTIEMLAVSKLETTRQKDLDDLKKILPHCNKKEIYRHIDNIKKNKFLSGHFENIDKIYNEIPNKKRSKQMDFEL